MSGGSQFRIGLAGTLSRSLARLLETLNIILPAEWILRTSALIRAAKVCFIHHFSRPSWVICSDCFLI